jgi:hypothetical protein
MKRFPEGGGKKASGGYVYSFGGFFFEHREVKAIPTSKDAVTKSNRHPQSSCEGLRPNGELQRNHFRSDWCK